MVPELMMGRRGALVTIGESTEKEDIQEGNRLILSIFFFFFNVSFEITWYYLDQKSDVKNPCALLYNVILS